MNIFVRSTTRSFATHIVRGRSAVAALASLALPIFFASSAQAQAGLVAAYGFNEAGGSTTTDGSGFNNTGTLTAGVTRTASGRYGGALIFNGATGRVNVADASSLALTTGMTLEAWVNPSVVNGNWRDIIHKTTDAYYLMVTTTNASRPAGGGRFNGEGGTTKTFGAVALTPNTWTHLAVTYDGAMLRFYVDGTQVSSVPRTGPIATSTSALGIGGDAIYGQFFEGMIDEVRIYNRALSATEVQTDMNTAIGSGPDAVSPTASITSPTSASTFATNATSVTLSGTAADNVGVTQVTWTNSAGGSGTASGTTSWTAANVSLQPGTNVLTVTARDAAGNTGTAVLTVTSDAVLPTVAITSPTSGPTYATTATPLALGGTASDNVSVTQVTWANNRGGSGTASGTTAWSVGAIVLQAGDNVLTVTARDAVGNVATSTLTVTYTIPDNTLPTVSITSPTSASTFATNATSVTLSGSAADNVGVTQVTWTNSAGGSGTATGTTSWSAASVALQPGSNVLTVTARDAAGNTGTAVLTVTSDAVLPTVAITSPTSGPTYATTATPLALGGTASDNVGVTQVTWANNRGGSGTASGTTAWSVSAIVLQTGDNVLTVTARDAVGNVATSTLTVTYTIPDNTLPTVSITSPTSASTFATNATSVTLSGTAADNVGVTQVTWTNSAGGSGTALGTTSWSAASVALQPGSNVLTVTARDAAGNTGTAVLTVTSDAVLPTVAITSPTSGPTYATTASPLALGGTASDNIGVTQVTWANNRGGSGTASGTTAWSVGAIVLQTGDNVLTVTARDAVGNVATSTLTVTYTVPDNTAPTISITSPTSASTYATNVTSLTVSGSAADNVGVTQVTWQNSAGGSGVATGTTSWSVTGIALQPGSNVISVTARDAANNVIGATLTVTQDAVVPTVAITSPAGGTVSSTISVAASASDNLGVVGVQFLLDGASLGAEVLGAGPYSTPWSTTSAANGTHILSARARDAAGNLSLAPDVSVTVSNAQPTGLVAAYGFNEASGSATTDASGANNNGTFGAGVTRTATGRFGGALVFNGAAGKVTVPDAASLRLTTAMTLEAWVNPSYVDGNWRDIIYKGNDNYYLMGMTTNASRPAGGGIFAGGPGTTQAYGAAAIGLNTWTHLAVTYDGAALRMYVNGTQVSSVARTGSIMTSNNPLEIGSDAIYQQGFLGAIDEVRVYNRALTATEVQNDMNTAIGVVVPPDVTVPTVAITSPTSTGSFATNATSVALSGSAADNVGVTQVTWSNSAGGSGTASGTTSWSAASITLQPGSNVLTVTARDAAGNIGTAVLTVTSDPVPPTVAITSPTSGSTFATTTTPISIGGSAGDNIGVTQVTWSNNRGGSGVAAGTTSWSVSGIALQTGDNILTVTARDGIGNSASTTLTVTYTVPDNTAPTIGITSPTPGETFETNTTSLALSGNAADNVGVTQVTWVNSAGGSGTATGTTNWSIAGITLQTGTNIITVTARDAAGNIGTAVLTVTSDPVPPTVAITTPTSGATFSTTTTPISIGGTAGDNVGVTQVTWTNSRGGSGAASGTANWSVSSIVLQTGDNVITVTARDAVGNVATSTLTVTYTVPDNTVPTIGITSPTAGSTYETNATSLTLSGSAADNVGVTQVTWANSAGGSGTATGTTSWRDIAGIVLQAGSNVVTVTAHDAAGNVGTAVLTITSDPVPPSVAITSPTSGSTFSTTATPIAIGGSAGDNVGVTQVTWANNRGGSGVATGTTGWSVSGIVLQAGDNVLTVTARDAVGNVATSTLTVTYTVPDNTVPTIGITSPTAGATYETNATSLTMSGSAADNVGVTQVTWENSAGGSGTAAGTTSWTISGLALHTGSNIITVTAHDAAGNVGTAVLTVTSDPVVPTVAITTPTTGTTFSTTATPLDLGGAASDNVGVTQVTWANNRGGSGTAAGTTSWSVAGIVLQTGDNILTVTARDAVGNVATTTLTVTYTVPDNTSPTATITGPTSGATYATSAASVTLSGSAADNVAVTQVTWQNSAGGTGTATGTTSWSATAIALQPGSNVITVTAHDAAGNVGTAVLTVTSDQVVPTVAITSPTTAATFSTTTTPLDLGGTAADNVGVTQVTWSNSRGGSGTATGTTSWAVTGIVLQTGDNVLTVTAHDAVGNVATSTLTVTYTIPDNTAPTVSVTSPTSAPTYSTNLAAITVSGTAADNVGVTQVTWTNSAGGSGTAAGTTSWSIAGIALQPGSNVITVRAVDAANNPATATLTVTQDAIVPTVTVTAPGAGSTVAATITVNASASDNIGVVGVQFLLDGATLGSLVTGAGPVYSTTWVTTAASNGTHVLAARATDAAGNTSVSPDVSVTVSNAVQPPGLVAAYAFNEPSGTTTSDASSAGNNGSFGSGVTRTGSGKFGGALTFNNGMVTIPNNASLSLTTAMTLEAWVNPSVVDNNWRDIIYKGNDNFYLMGMTSNGSRPAGGGTFGSGGPVETFGSASLAANTWTHLALTYNGSTLRLYVNGTQVSTVNQTGAIATSTNPLQIGGDPIYGQDFQGMIDEVRVYNRALTATEIQSDMTTAIVSGPPADAQVPTIAITTPTGTGSYVTTTSPLAIGGTSSDNVGVTQVTWSNDRGGSGTAAGTTTWSVSGIVLQPGANVVTVSARDAANNVATATLTVTLDVPDTSLPTVTITAPTTAATYTTNLAAVAVGGTAADNVGVTQVTWTNSAGGSGTATGTTSWTASGITLQSGSNIITVTARDAANNQATATLTITRDIVVPTVVLTAPGAGATVSGTNTTITASATDDHALAGVQMLLDGVALGTEVLGTGPTYTFLWNTTAATNGSHTLSARVRDAAGNTALAPDVSVTIANAAPAGLVAAYGFEEVSGTTAIDASGNNNNGTLDPGVIRTTVGRLGAAVAFNGSSKITVPNAASLNLTTGMTLEAWVHPSSVDANWRDVIYKSPDNYFIMGSSPNGNRPAGGASIGGGTAEALGTSALSASVWTHLAVTYDGAAVRLYVNGSQVSSVARTGLISPSTNPLEIGGDAAFQQYFLGSIDEVRVYNRALTSNEIQNDMVTPVTDSVPPPPLSATGQWSAPFNWPLISIHAALLKTGEVLGWEYNAAGGPVVWNPSTGTFTAVTPTTTSNLFCGGQAALPDGRILVAGGHSDVHVGIPELNIFDPAARTWTRAPDMSIARWYPSVTALPDGRAMITAGEINCDGCNALIPEIYDPVSNTVTRLTGASANFTYYPYTYVMPDGRVVVAGSSEAPVVTKVLDIPTQTWSVVDPTAVDGGSSVMYLPGKIMKSGTSHNPDVAIDPSSPNTYVLDMTQATPRWQSTQPMAFPRTYHTMTVLPDGNVVATGGGMTTDAVAPNGVLAAELWSPSTQTWTTAASAAVTRLYHSIALLLPDGRVLVSGGGRFNGYPSSDPSDKLNAELYSPPYLFKGARPVISSAPATSGYGATIPVQTPDAANIASVSLIRLGAVTHTINMDQRYLPLTFTSNGGALDVQMPANANLAPPGYYMLFIVNSNGVPSVASMIRMQ